MRSAARFTTSAMGIRANGSSMVKGRSFDHTACASGIASARRASTPRRSASVKSIRVSYVAYAQ